MTLVDIKDLKLKTGCSLRDAREAIQYAEEHEECTPLGYLKAKYFAVKIEPFEKKVRLFSK